MGWDKRKPGYVRQVPQGFKTGAYRSDLAMERRIDVAYVHVGYTYSAHMHGEGTRNREEGGVGSRGRGGGEKQGAHCDDVILGDING